MKLSEEMAVRLHRMMWSDMQKELGDKPSEGNRLTFKSEWIEINFPGQDVLHRCFLCEYAQQIYSDKDSGICRNCPIVWPGDFCNGVIKSYATMPISEILALPAKNERFNKKAANIHDLSRDIVVGEVAKASGLPVECDIWSHIKAIQEKAVEEYFEKKPAAKLATMDVDQAFKQYADEQKAPIFKQLSNASGLSENNHAVLDHIILIKNKAKQEGRDETKQQMKDLLAEQSDLDRHRPVDDHIREIVKNSMEAGAAEERDRIQEKIYEVLLS